MDRELAASQQGKDPVKPASPSGNLQCNAGAHAHGVYPANVCEEELFTPLVVGQIQENSNSGTSEDDTFPHVPFLHLHATPGSELLQGKTPTDNNGDGHPERAQRVAHFASRMVLRDEGPLLASRHAYGDSVVLTDDQSRITGHKSSFAASSPSLLIL